MSDKALDHIVGEIAHKFSKDYDFFCEAAPLKVQTKEAGVVKVLKPNAGQKLLRQAIKRQMLERGYVRLVILKARQIGFSTDIAGYFFQKTMTTPHTKTEVMAHKEDAARELFEKFEFYYGNMNPTLQRVRPLGDDSAKSKTFKGINSKYSVSTAGSRETGRAVMRHNLHLSEVAFYPDSEKIFAGMVNTVPTRGRDTAIIIESTANGMTGNGKYFYNLVQQALLKRSEYELLFVPWFIMPEYQITPDDDFKRTEEEEELATAYSLNDSQLMFRRVKIAEKSTPEEGLYKFKQEYPSNIEEAFQSSANPLIPHHYVHKAMNTIRNEWMGLGEATVLGVDCASRQDRAVIFPRTGKKYHEPWVHDCSEDGDGMLEPMDLAEIIMGQIVKWKPDKVFIDEGEIGFAVASRLKQLGVGHLVVTVNFGGKPTNPIYFNKRAEMWCTLRDHIVKGCSLPNRHDLAMDLSMVPQYISKDGVKIQLLSKEKIAKENDGLSPDLGDAAALTHAQEVIPLDLRMNHRQMKRKFK